jgi:hypothetical protein
MTESRCAEGEMVNPFGQRAEPFRRDQSGFLTHGPKEPSMQMKIAGSILAVALWQPVSGSAARASVPDFSSMTNGWLAMGTDFKEVPGSPAIVVNDAAHPHVGNGSGRQSSFRFADLNNPNLTDFAKAQPEERPMMKSCAARRCSRARRAAGRRSYRPTI